MQSTRSHPKTHRSKLAQKNLKARFNFSSKTRPSPLLNNSSPKYSDIPTLPLSIGTKSVRLWANAVLRPKPYFSDTVKCFNPSQWQQQHPSSLILWQCSNSSSATVECSENRSSTSPTFCVPFWTWTKTGTWECTNWTISLRAWSVQISRVKCWRISEIY